MENLELFTISVVVFLTAPYTFSSYFVTLPLWRVHGGKSAESNFYALCEYFLLSLLIFDSSGYNI